MSPLRGRVQLGASAAASIVRDHEIEGGVTIPELGDHRLALNFSASTGHLAQERFFGAGLSSARADETTFALDRRSARLDLTVTGTRWLRVAAGAGFASLKVGDGSTRGIPGISTRWNRDAGPGLDSTSYALFSTSATADWRDVPGNPRRGGRYEVRLERYSDRSLNRYSFNRVNVELEQHLSWWRRQRVLTLRGMAVVSAPDSGNDVPFYLQPTLGGSHVLRGFVTDRFRDRNALALQAEYGWDIWPFLGAVLFYEAGAVAHDWQTMTLKNLKRDYGIGFRLGSSRTIALRTDVAFGSGEGTRIAMRFSHAF
jgi:outer membrane protein assembly factor BamA